MGCSASGDSLQYRLRDVPIFLPAYSADDTTVYLFTDAMSQHATPTSVCLLLHHDASKTLTVAIAKICLFCGLSAQTVRPPPKLMHEGHILGMSTWTSPRNDSHCPKLCRLSSTPWKYQFSVVFWTGKIPCRNSKNFQRFMHAHTDSRLLFHKCSKSMQDNWPKVHVLLVTTHFGILRWNTWGTFPSIFVWVRMTPDLYSRFHPDPFRFGDI